MTVSSLPLPVRKSSAGSVTVPDYVTVHVELFLKGSGRLESVIDGNLLL